MVLTNAHLVNTLRRARSKSSGGVRVESNHAVIKTVHGVAVESASWDPNFGLLFPFTGVCIDSTNLILARVSAMREQFSQINRLKIYIRYRKGLRKQSAYVCNIKDCTKLSTPASLCWACISTESIVPKKDMACTCSESPVALRCRCMGICESVGWSVAFDDGHWRRRNALDEEADDEDDNEGQ